jgi:hypothetical protein
MLLQILLGIIGTGLTLAPFIGLILDLRKSKKHLLALAVAGIMILISLLLSLMLRSAIISTLFAFTMVPALFIYVLLSSKKKNSTEEKQSETLD